MILFCTALSDLPARNSWVGEFERKKANYSVLVSVLSISKYIIVHPFYIICYCIPCHRYWGARYPW